VEIGAPPEDIWPWLVQMGYNRAGWYTYDLVDMKGASVGRIVRQLQHLAAGDAVPNSPDTAFEVGPSIPGRALVLYADEATSRAGRRARAKKAAGRRSRIRQPTSGRPAA